MPGPLSAVRALNICPRSVYPNVHVPKLLQILVTLLVSTAEPKKCFQNWTMSEDRLDAVMLTQAHRQRVIDLSADDITDNICHSVKWTFVRSFIIVGRGPAYSGASPGR